MDQPIFALDIGTRSVIGIAGHSKNGVFKILAVEAEEYKNRVVVDGQIDDIAQTAQTASLVKSRIEEKLGVELNNVYIAAAGRALKTIEISYETEIDSEYITADFNKKLEYLAVEKAIEEIGEDKGRAYFYVGHTVQKYLLDGYEIKSALDHKGSKIEVFLIVTFLPKEVVESLYMTMKRIGLSVAGLTLEPIAAMNVIIPSELRKLNLALCDIGAGTSDIAICENGSVTGYTMATIAGDEITENIMEVCLCDFETAEQIKKQIILKDAIKYQNILGMEEEVSASELYVKIEETIKKLATTIAERIVQINGKKTSAVFLVGGGSKSPHLKKYVAEALELDEKFISVGGNVYMKKLVESDLDVYTPEFATPLGIAISAADKNMNNGFSVKVNGENVHLFNVWDTSVLSILQMRGYRYTQIIGKSGGNLKFMLNGEEVVARGSVASPARVVMNGKEVTLSTKVNPSEEIEFHEARDGSDAKAFIYDYIENDEEFIVYINSQAYSLENIAKINGRIVSSSAQIYEGDKVEIRRAETIEDLLTVKNINAGDAKFFVNNKEENIDYVLFEGDNIDIFTEEVEENASATHNLSKVSILMNGKILELPTKPNSLPYQFFDILSYANIDTSKPKGKLVMQVNKVDAESYLQEINNGDKVDIYWLKEDKI